MMLAFALMAITTFAKGSDDVAGVKFGTDKAAALSQFETSFGKKGVVEGDAVTFSNVKYLGYTFTSAKVYFNSANKFNQARFYVAEPSKKAAEMKLNALEKMMQQNYGSLSADQDEDGKFVKGGLGPDGQSLFTIYTVRMQGKWFTGLRYGAFDI